MGSSALPLDVLRVIVVTVMLVCFRFYRSCVMYELHVKLCRFTGLTISIVHIVLSIATRQGQERMRRVAALAYTCTLQKLQIGRVHDVPGTRPAVAVGTLSEHCWCMVQVRGHAPKQTACRSELPDRRSCGHKLGAALYAAPPSAAGSSTDGLLGLVRAARAISG